MKYTNIKRDGGKNRISSSVHTGSSPELICRAVASDFKLRGITHLDAARMLGVEKRTVSNQISGKRPFGKKSAQQYAQVFGYEEPFLLYGIGSLKKNAASQKLYFSPSSDQSQETIASLTDRIELLEKMVAMQNRQIVRMQSRGIMNKALVKAIRKRNITIGALDLAKKLAVEK